MDVEHEPLVLSVPEMTGRYYLVQVCDYWTNSQSLGTRTTGSAAQDFVFVGPGRKGTVPEGMTAVKLATNKAWTFISTQFNGPSDLAAANQVQGGYQLTPLSSWGKKYTAPANVPVDKNVNTTTTPAAQVKAYSAETFLSQLGPLMAPNPPAAADAPVIAQLARIGIVPGQPFDWGKLNPAEQTAAQAGIVKARLATDKAAAAPPGSSTANHWLVANNWGTYGTDYLLRAVVSLIGLGAELPQDQMYPFAVKDSQGKLLNGNNTYTIHFDKGQFPPTDAIWSLTLYDDQLHLSANSANRYNISPNQQKLSYNSDGSLDIYIQNTQPSSTAQQANWLPAPAAPFILVLQVYSPKEALQTYKWTAPPIVKQ